ncbi:pimeloyl-ACP methyl ester carboxylesterase [Mesorhizobium sp. USDA 4775]
MDWMPSIGRPAPPTPLPSCSSMASLRPRACTLLIPLLADTYHVIAPDYPGFGHIEAPSRDRYSYTFDALAASISALLAYLKIDSYALFMQDYGGPVGFRMALSRPDQVKASYGGKWVMTV